METWESIWRSLLREACWLAAQAAQNQSRQLSRSSASVILACVSWEAFINELIQWRSLKVTKRTDFLPKLKKVLQVLEPQKDGEEVGPDWNDLIGFMKLRNLIVHHKAEPYRAGNSPREFPDALRKFMLTDSEEDSSTWERAIVHAHTASTCCRVVAASIIRLERLPLYRTRNPTEVEQAVLAAIEPLAQLHSSE